MQLQAAEPLANDLRLRGPGDNSSTFSSPEKNADYPLTGIAESPNGQSQWEENGVEQEPDTSYSGRWLMN